MEEQQVTMDGVCRTLESPFLIIGTQNPIDHEGTYRLPEAQQDRFLFKLYIDYPSIDNEVEIINRHQSNNHKPDISKIKTIVNKEKLEKIKATIAAIKVKDEIIRYIAELVTATRNNPSIYFGASPRASINLLKSAKTLAAINGRDFVIPEDVKEMAFPVLNHRITLTPEKDMEGQTAAEVLKSIVAKVSVPR
jgi:MoxR-like ATPase